MQRDHSLKSEYGFFRPGRCDLRGAQYRLCIYQNQAEVYGYAMQSA